MPVNSMYKAAGALGAVAALVLAGCGSDDKKESIGDPLSRAAKGELSARRRRSTARRRPDRHHPRHHQRLGRPQRHPADR